MNATRAATIRLRSSFDGAVSLGRVQTPTLAILARREQEIRAFKPEPYWIVDATFATVTDRREYEGRYHAGANPRIKSPDEAAEIVRACENQSGEITKLEKTERKERAPLLYDLTSLQRDANSRFGFSARRTLAAAQRLYEEHKALTYPRTNSRYITQDMVGDIKPIAGLVGEQTEYAAGSKYVLGLDVLPLGRVVNDAKVTDHHAIIPTRAERHPVDKMSSDDRRIYDLVVKRFLAIFHPDAVFENTRVETTVAGHVFRTRGKVMLVPGWRGVYGETADADTERADDDEGREQQLPKLERGEHADVEKIGSEEKETKPPRRYTEGALLAAMETAGKLVDEDELREAMKESGIGTPATRAAIIERLLQVAYIERDGRALVVTEKGLNVIRLLGEHALTSPGLTGDWEHRLAKIETGADSREAFMGDIVKFTEATVAELDANLKDVRIPRANLGPCPVCGHDIVENRKGYSCWAREDPGMRVRDLEVQGRQAAADRGGQGADQDRPHREAGHRLQGPVGKELPLALGPPAERRGQVAGRVRRAVGQGGRQAARGRGRGGRRDRSRRRRSPRSRAGRGLVALRSESRAEPSGALATIGRWR